MRLSRMPRLGVLAITTVLLAGAAAAASGATVDRSPSSPAGFPSLRLIVTESELEQVRPPDNFLVVEQVPSFVATVGGTFEIHLNRQADGVITAQQVVRDGNGEITERRRLPRWAVADLTQGLDSFFRVTLTNDAGDVIHTSDIPFCPLTAERSKVDDTGPALPTYPWYCLASELTTGMVWGIDNGWSARAPDSFFVAAEVPDGTYQLDIEINRKFRDLFRIPADQARATMSLTVTTGDGIDGGIGDGEAIIPAVGDIHGSQGRTREAPEVAADASGLPDLIALPPFNISIAGPDDPASEGLDGLSFGANVWNGGDGPLVVEGFRRPGEPVMDAYQYFYESGVSVRRELVGELEFDPQPGHRHWHFKDFAQYRIIDDAGSEVARSGKEAFCLAPTDPVDLTLPNATFRPYDTGLATSCGFFGALWIREILDVGWGDTYYQSVPGQWIDISDVANGEYLLEVATNQDGRLQELRADNNVATTRISLGGKPGARTVEVVGGSS